MVTLSGSYPLSGSFVKNSNANNVLTNECAELIVIGFSVEAGGEFFKLMLQDAVVTYVP
jgi:hypothetical protein